MTTLHDLTDLRSMLADHAEAAPAAVDHAALCGRIHQARTRRRTSVVGAVVAAVFVVGGIVAGVTSGGHGAAPVIAGYALPQTVQVYDFGYRLDRAAQSEPGGHTLTMKLPKVEVGRVVTLVASGPGMATLRENDQDIARASDEVSDPVPLSSDKEKITVVVRGGEASTVIGLAVYGRDGSMPDGVSNGTMVFRDRVAGRTLLGAGWGTPGQRSVTFTFQGSAKAYGIAQVCLGAGAQQVGEVTVDGQRQGGVSCRAADPLDEDASGVVDEPEGVPLLAGQHTVTVSLTDQKDHPISKPGIVLGVALYDLGEQRTIRGMPVDELVEQDGRDWRLDRVVVSSGGLRVTGPAYVAAVVGRGEWGFTGRHVTAGDRDLQVPSTDNGTGGTSMSGLGEVLQGSTYDFSGQDEGKPDAKITFLVYRPAD